MVELFNSNIGRDCAVKLVKVKVSEERGGQWSDIDLNETTMLQGLRYAVHLACFTCIYILIFFFKSDRLTLLFVRACGQTNIFFLALSWCQLWQHWT